MKYSPVIAESISIINYTSKINDLPLEIENKKIVITSDFHF